MCRCELPHTPSNGAVFAAMIHIFIIANSTRSKTSQSSSSPRVCDDCNCRSTACRPRGRPHPTINKSHSRIVPVQRGAGAVAAAVVSTNSGRTGNHELNSTKFSNTMGQLSPLATTRTEGGIEVRISGTADGVGDNRSVRLIPQVSIGTVESVLIGSLRADSSQRRLPHVHNHTSAPPFVKLPSPNQHHEVRRLVQFECISELPLGSSAQLQKRRHVVLRLGDDNGVATSTPFDVLERVNPFFRVSLTLVEWR